MDGINKMEFICELLTNLIATIIEFDVGVPVSEPTIIQHSRIHIFSLPRGWLPTWLPDRPVGYSHMMLGVSVAADEPYSGSTSPARNRTARVSGTGHAYVGWKYFA